MIRPNYFEILEGLSKNALEAVSIGCGYGVSSDVRQTRECTIKRKRERISELRVESDKMICTLENALFSDFIPPLQRDNIASLAHSFWRVTDRAVDLYRDASGNSRLSQAKPNEEEKLCIALAERLSEGTAMLRQIRSPDKMPPFCDFRELLRRASDAHNEYISRINGGNLPHACALRAFSVARVRFELSRCFDELIEVMLGNI